MTLVSIKRPDTLIRLYLNKDGCHCAVGWLAKECGLEYPDGDYGVGHHGFFELRRAYGLGSEQIMDLMGSNDACEDGNERIRLFEEFCKENDIAFLPLQPE